MSSTVDYVVIVGISCILYGVLSAPNRLPEENVSSILLLSRRYGDTLIHSERIFSNSSEINVYHFVPYRWNNDGDQKLTAVHLRLPGVSRFD